MYFIQYFDQIEKQWTFLTDGRYKVYCFDSEAHAKAQIHFEQQNDHMGWYEQIKIVKGEDI